MVQAVIQPFCRYSRSLPETFKDCPPQLNRDWLEGFDGTGAFEFRVLLKVPYELRFYREWDVST